MLMEKEYRTKKYNPPHTLHHSANSESEEEKEGKEERITPLDHHAPKTLFRLVIESKVHFFSLCLLLSAALLSSAWIITSQTTNTPQSTKKSPPSSEVSQNAPSTDDLEKRVIPAEGIPLPIQWGDLGKQLVETGVIDKEKLISLYAERGGLDPQIEQLLTGTYNEPVVINESNSGFLLNLLWALGLGNKNQILEKGPMSDPQYGGADRFASTGGWTLAKGDVMKHFSKHPFVPLTPEQQELVEQVTKNIFRPCCGNSTYFPDCNHGMAMLGLVELMASQGISEVQMYRTALAVNSYWFPDTYLAIAQFLAKKGISWEEADPQEILGEQFSSASGYRQILSEVTPPERRSSGGCGV